MGYVELVELIFAGMLLWMSYYITPNPHRAKSQIRIRGIGLIPVLYVALAFLVILTTIKRVTRTPTTNPTTSPTTQNVER